MKYTMTRYLSVAIFLIIGCSSRDSKQTPATVTVRVRDTVYLPSNDTYFKDSLYATLNVLLMQYYSAGWMDGTNKLVDLYNQENFTESAIEKERVKYWAKMRQQLNEKSK